MHYIVYSLTDVQNPASDRLKLIKCSPPRIPIIPRTSGEPRRRISNNKKNIGRSSATRHTSPRHFVGEWHRAQWAVLRPYRSNSPNRESTSHVASNSRYRLPRLFATAQISSFAALALDHRSRLDILIGSDACPAVAVPFRVSIHARFARDIAVWRPCRCRAGFLLITLHACKLYRSIYALCP